MFLRLLKASRTRLEQPPRQAGGFNVAAVAGCKIWRMWSHVKLSELSDLSGSKKTLTSRFASAHEGLQPTRLLHLWARRAASPTCWISLVWGIRKLGHHSLSESTIHYPLDLKWNLCTSWETRFWLTSASRKKTPDTSRHKICKSHLSQISVICGKSTLHLKRRPQARSETILGNIYGNHSNYAHVFTMIFCEICCLLWHSASRQYREYPPSKSYSPGPIPVCPSVFRSCTATDWRYWSILIMLKLLCLFFFLLLLLLLLLLLWLLLWLLLLLQLLMLMLTRTYQNHAQDYEHIWKRGWGWGWW